MNGNGARWRTKLYESFVRQRRTQQNFRSSFQAESPRRNGGAITKTFQSRLSAALPAFAGAVQGDTKANGTFRIDQAVIERIDQDNERTNKKCSGRNNKIKHLQ